MTLLARSWLYVPASSPQLLDKAMAGAADAVVLDLEDSVTQSTKDAARAGAVAAVSRSHPKPLWVRMNHPGNAAGHADIRALSETGVAGIRIPKAEDPDLVATTAEALGKPVHLLIESALGLHRAYELARCHPAVAAISLGETDLAADLRIRNSAALEWARAQVVVAARAAKLPSPVHSVWTDLRDTDGLARDTRRARDHGFFGRSVIHPRQVEVVNRVFTPDHNEIRSARDLMNSLREKEIRQEGAWLDDNGRFVDEAVVAQARWLLDLAGALPDGTEEKGRNDEL